MSPGNRSVENGSLSIPRGDRCSRPCAIPLCGGGDAVQLGSLSFYYGTAIWLLRAAGLRLAPSVLLVTAMLASIEIVQIHLPGRVPETTDPVLAILLGFVLAILSRETGKRFQSAE
jgi:hypothetical protein